MAAIIGTRVYGRGHTDAFAAGNPELVAASAAVIGAAAAAAVVADRGGDGRRPVLGGKDDADDTTGEISGNSGGVELGLLPLWLTAGLDATDEAAAGATKAAVRI